MTSEIVVHHNRRSLATTRSRSASVIESPLRDPVLHDRQLRRGGRGWSVVWHARAERRRDAELFYLNAFAWLAWNDDSRSRVQSSSAQRLVAAEREARGCGRTVARQTAARRARRQRANLCGERDRRIRIAVSTSSG